MRARIGALLQLGSRYEVAKDKNKAAWCYLYAARIATVSPLLSDAVRLDTFLQVGAGLRAVGAADAARLAVGQAYLVAQHSPVLRRESAARPTATTRPTRRSTRPRASSSRSRRVW